MEPSGANGRGCSCRCLRSRLLELAASALGGLPSGIERSDLAAAVIVGVNLGPNLTTIGSLATMLWLVLMRRRGPSRGRAPTSRSRR